MLEFTPESRFGQPIRMHDYMEQFMSEAEGAPRAAVKRLTATIEGELRQLTINAPDWLASVFYSALSTDMNLSGAQGHVVCGPNGTGSLMARRTFY